LLISRSDWNPGAYARFRGLRLRPALDLLAQVGVLPDGQVIDLGCGDGIMGGALISRFGEIALTGIDASPAMLTKAAEWGQYDTLVQSDIAAWQPDRPPALIFSNAALHWLPNHGSLFPRLARMLAEGGTLAIQMPAQFEAPSHALLRQIAGNMFPERFDFTGFDLPVQGPEAYHCMLAPLGEVAIWATEYLQHQPATPEGHPVRAFTESTAMRPFLDPLTRNEADAFTAAYDAALDAAYPRLPDGSALFRFRRLFIILKV
jgi:trans-aconitate 2-methyltransferase